MRRVGKVMVALWVAAFVGALGAQAQVEDTELATVKGHVFERSAGGPGPA